VDAEDNGDDLWEIWYRDLASIFQEIHEDLIAGKISLQEAYERMNKV
jgi:hypothetical protein